MDGEGGSGIQISHELILALQMCVAPSSSHDGTWAVIIFFLLKKEKNHHKDGV